MQRAFLLSLAVLAVTGFSTLAFSQEDAATPNVVVIFCDDMGYADLSCFGADKIRTPHIDRMAEEGIRLTNFHVAQAVCSASRTALLTGCYPNRLGIHGALGPKARHGIHADETTLAEVFKSRGYRTAIYGKWHLGHHRQFLPKQHGFDEYWGIPYSNDMWPFHPTAGARFPPLPLIDGDETVETNPDQRRLTTEIAERSVAFIEKNKDQPFFLYVPHPMPHVPLFVSDARKGKSAGGLYGDVIEEIDWSVGEILGALKKNGLDEKTLVIFTSDNGPWLSYGDHGGSAKPLREGKGTSWEGGVRVPCVMRWPGKLPAGREIDTPLMSIDILPTCAGLIGATLSERKIDGKDIWPVLRGDAGAESPQEAYWIYYRTNELHAVISGKWKLYLPHSYRSLGGRAGGTGGRPVRYEQKRIETELYDLRADVREKVNVVGEHPGVVLRMLKYVEQAREDLGDSLTKRPGKGRREPGRLPKPRKKAG